MLSLTITLILWPYLFFAGRTLTFSLDGIDSTLLLLLSIVYIILSAIMHNRYLRYAKTLGLPLERTAKYNLLLKLIPAVCDILLYGPLTVSHIKTHIDISSGAMMCVPTFLFYFIILLPYNLSRIFSLLTTMRTSHYLLEEYYWRRQQNMLHRCVWLHTILHFVPVAHIISNIVICQKLRKLQTETIEP